MIALPLPILLAGIALAWITLITLTIRDHNRKDN